VRGGAVQMHKAPSPADGLPQGLLGRITLETPAEMAAWLQAAAEEVERKAAQREAEKAADKARRSGRRAASSGDAA
jgi:ribosome biogenesis GTPase A